MLRCESVGNYKVTFRFLDNDGGRVENGYNAPIGPHENIWKIVSTDRLVENYDPPLEGAVELLEAEPRVTIDTPYEGELCQHELDYLTSIPAYKYNRHWRYAVKEIK